MYYFENTRMSISHVVITNLTQYPANAIGCISSGFLDKLISK